MQKRLQNKSSHFDQQSKARQNRSILRLITCGSVDDGKSTLIGRLLYDSKVLGEDQISNLERDSKKFGTQGNNTDFALLIDGLSAEREQGITIDVAYRYFSSKKRRYIVADTPGHEQYTRNMVTGASTAELAIILIDASKGVRKQTSRHTFICKLLGIKNIILAVNKMDIVGYREKEYSRIVAQYLKFTKEIGFTKVITIPISSLLEIILYQGPLICHGSEGQLYYQI